jgi:hypothetical protein
MFLVGQSRHFGFVPLPVCPQLQTFSAPLGTSQRCHERTLLLQAKAKKKHNGR